MSATYFTIKGIGPFDGLDVTVAEQKDPLVYEPLAAVLSIRNRGVMIGDRPWQAALPPQAFYVNKKFLVDCPFPDVMEFDDRKPFSNFVESDSFLLNSDKVVITRYTNAVTLSVMTEDGDTAFTNNYTTAESMKSVLALYSSAKDVPSMFSLSDFIFRLGRIR